MTRRRGRRLACPVCEGDLQPEEVLGLEKLRRELGLNVRRGSNPRLTSEKVAEIRAAYEAGEARQVELARRYGVSQALISQIVRGERWKEW